MRCFRLLFSMCLFLPAISASAQQVWFAPNDNLARGQNRDLYLNHDFPHLFDPSPAWGAKTDVFAISPMMGSTVGPADQLDRINAFLIEHHIALAVGIGAAQGDNKDPVPGECGFGVEGMNRPNRNAITFKRLKNLGIEIQYVFMDEPLTFAHFYDKKNACRYSIEDTARRVAASIAEIRQYYPDVKVVAAEAPNSTSPQRWNTEFPQWLAAYRRATGTPLDAVVFDIDWRLPWKNWVLPSVATAHKAGVRAGMFLTGTADRRSSDADAIAAYKQNALAVEQAKLPLDLVIVANWTPRPSRNLPESNPETLTSFLHWYQTHHQ